MARNDELLDIHAKAVGFVPDKLSFMMNTRLSVVCKVCGKDVGFRKARSVTMLQPDGAETLVDFNHECKGKS